METELRLWENLAAWQPDATLLVISHRQPVLRRADRLLLLAEPLTAHPEMRAIWSGETKEAELRVPDR